MQILTIRDTSIQVIIQDNSDNMQLKDLLLPINDNRLKYNYEPKILSFVDNFSEAISLADGEYICIMMLSSFIIIDLLTNHLPIHLISKLPYLDRYSKYLAGEKASTGITTLIVYCIILIFVLLAYKNIAKENEKAAFSYNMMTFGILFSFVGFALQIFSVLDIILYHICILFFRKLLMLILNQKTDSW